MSEEVYLVGCHVENEQQSNLLKRLVSHLHFFGKNFVLVSHTPLPEECINKSVGYIYDKSNPVYWRWELDNPHYYYFHSPNFNIACKYILYGASPYYHVGVLRLLLNGIKYIKTLNYKIVHWIEYDMFPDFDRAEKNKKLIEQGNEFIFHGVGSFFSFSSDIELKNHYQNFSNESLLKCLKENEYIAEKVIMNDLFKKEPFKIFDVIENAGEYSQNFDKIKVHWCLFEENENEVDIFLLNKRNQEIEVTYSYNQYSGTRKLLPNMYYRNRLGAMKKEGLTTIKIVVDKELFFEFQAESNYVNHNLIKDVVSWVNE